MAKLSKIQTTEIIKRRSWTIMFTRHAMLCRITHNNKIHANASSLTINSYFSECCKKYIFSLLHLVYAKNQLSFVGHPDFLLFATNEGRSISGYFLAGWLTGTLTNGNAGYEVLGSRGVWIVRHTAARNLQIFSGWGTSDSRLVLFGWRSNM